MCNNVCIYIYIMYTAVGARALDVSRAGPRVRPFLPRLRFHKLRCAPK